jgi:hypothetical protein
MVEVNTACVNWSATVALSRVVVVTGRVAVDARVELVDDLRVDVDPGDAAGLPEPHPARHSTATRNASRVTGPIVEPG